MLSDGELLQRYIDEKSESAFNELVQRHLNVVYFAALRRVGLDAHFASDVTQRVFTDLARKASQLKSRPSLAGWLHTATRFTAAEIVRSERRRRTHEQEAHAMNELNAPAALSPGPIDPVLDEVLDVLTERDRDAILLHFFEGCSFVEVGAALSLSADAARMRVNRALDQLREALQKRGVESTAAALATALSAQSSLAAPASVAGSVAGKALVLAATGTGGIPWISVAAASIAVMAIGTILVIRSPTANPAAPAPAEVSVQAPQSSTTTGQAPGTDEPTVDSISVGPQSGAAAANTTSTSEFGRMTEAEKNVLKTLWTHAQVATDFPPNSVWAFGVPPASPNGPMFAEGRDALAARGLIRIGVNGLNAALTPLGRTFCNQHDNEISTRALVFTLSGPASPLTIQPPADFDALPTNEKNLLKRLVGIEDLHPPSGDMRTGLMMHRADSPPASLFNQAVSRLVAMRFVNIGQAKGVVYLTDAGRAFCLSQRPRINEHQLPVSSPK